MRFVPLVMFLAVSNTLCQTPTKENDTLQSLLVEVHQLRQAMEGMTVASQRVQIALSALQMQDAVVARSMQRLEETRRHCLGQEQERQRTASLIQQLEGALAAGTMPEGEIKQARGQISAMKTRREAQTAEVQACQATEAEVASQLRNDQAKLGEWQDRIGNLDKTLEKLSVTVK